MESRQHFWLILFIVLADFAHISRCEQEFDENGESTSVNSHRRKNEFSHNRDESQEEIPNERVHPSHLQKSHNTYRRKQNHHETMLRVLEPSNLESVTSSTEQNPPDPIIEEGEMMAEITREEESTKKYDNRPNIILIMTDDQDVELGSMNYMPETLKIFRDNGIEFRHGYVATPMCCPSRSSILTGLYVHNHNVYTNNDNCSSLLWREKHEKKTFGAHLWSSGYYTSYIGKYLNKYDGNSIPYGWDQWNGLLMNSKFYNYTVNVNGRKQRHGHDYQSDYYPDLIANDTLEFLSRVVTEESKQPFLLVASFPSPHGPEDSAPQYSNLFLNTTSHHTPSYNYAPNSDKQWILRKTNKMTPVLKDFTNLLMAKRLQTLQSVDVAVKSIMDKLEASGLDENTYVFYTSDHGYHVGQFGLVKGKSMPFEFDIRVPFFLHGPSSKVKKGIQILEPVMNIDLAPTFLDLAGIQVPAEMDGRSVVPLIQRYGPNTKPEELEAPFVWKDVFLIESSGRREIPGDSQNSKKTKKSREEKLKQFLSDNETVRIDNLCLLHPYPCLPGQKKYCHKDKDQDRPHFRKCRHSDFLEDPFLSLRVNDPLYQVISANASNSDDTQLQGDFKRCRCRVRRSANLEEEDEIHWEMERQKIDQEIDQLRKRIDDLKSRRRNMRRKLFGEAITNHTTTTPTFPIGKDFSTDQPRRRKGKIHKNSGKLEEEKTFSVDDFEDEEKLGFPTSSSTTTTTISTSTKNDEKEDEDEEEDDEDEEEDEEEEGEDDTDDEEDSSEEDEETVRKESSNRKAFETTEHTTTTTTTTTSTTPPTTTEGKKSDLGLDFDDFEMESFVRPHQKNKKKNRHHNRNRPHHRYRGQGKGQLIPTPNKDYGNSDLEDIKVSKIETEECDCYNDPRWIRQRERDERKRKKILNKIRKKHKYMKRIDNPDLRKQAESCGAEEKMNCFWHDKDHWKSEPRWEGEGFCFCMNSNNNTYSCLRSVNATHNYLYCQFVTGFKMYFDLREDPFQMKNAIGTLPAAQEDWMLVQLIRLKKCKGRAECWGEIDHNEQAIQSSIWEQIFARWPKKKKRRYRKKAF